MILNSPMAASLRPLDCDGSIGIADYIKALPMKVLLVVQCIARVSMSQHPTTSNFQLPCWQTLLAEAWVPLLWKGAMSQIGCL